MNSCDKALELAARGFRVFPCNADKTPREPMDWRTLATRDPDEVMSLWGVGDDQDSLVAIACRESGIVALDEDRPGALDELGVPPPIWARQATPRGGRHWLYLDPDGLGNSTGRLPAGIDVRGAGYIVAWELPSFPTEPLPPSVRELLPEPGEHHKATPVDLDTWLDAHTAESDPAFGYRVLRRFKHRVAEGRSRHQEMQHHLCWLLEGVRDGLVSSRWVGIARGEFHHVKPDAKPNEFLQMLRWAVERVAAQAPLEPPQDVEEERWLWKVSELPRERPAPMSGIVAAGTWTAVHGPAGAGKSEAVAALVMPLAIGIDALTGEAIEPQRVLWVDGENGAVVVYERLSGVHGVAVAALDDHVRVLLGPERLARAVEAHSPAVVVIDGLNALLGRGDEENGSDAWRNVFAETIRPLRDRGIAVVTLDNSGKDVSRGARGSSVKLDKADLQLGLRRTTDDELEAGFEEGWAFSVDKDRRGMAPPERLAREATNEGVKVRVAGDPITPEVRAVLSTMYDVGMSTGLSVRNARSFLTERGRRPGRDEHFRAALKLYNGTPTAEELL